MAKIRPKSGQHPAIPSNYAIIRGLLALYPPLSAIFHHSIQTSAADIDRQADRVRGDRPGAGVGHARPHIGGSTCVCRVFAECPIVSDRQSRFTRTDGLKSCDVQTYDSCRKKSNTGGERNE